MEEKENVYFLEFDCLFGNMVKSYYIYDMLILNTDEVLGISSVLQQLSIDIQREGSSSCTLRYISSETSEEKTICLTSIVAFSTNIPNYQTIMDTTN